MSTNTQKPAVKAGVFRVIEGGLAKAEAPTPVVAAGQLPGEVEAERLRRALMKLPVPGIGLNVEQVADEIDSKLWSKELQHYQRSSHLTSSLEKLGLRFQMADPALDLAREGFLVLVWPDRLLDLHPELAGLHPLAHQYMTVG